MALDNAELFLVLLERSGFVSRRSIDDEISSIFNNPWSERDLDNSIQEMIDEGFICEFDTEDSVTFAHQDIEGDDGEIDDSGEIIISERFFYSLGPSALAYLLEHNSELLFQANQKNLSNATEILRRFQSSSTENKSKEKNYYLPPSKVDQLKSLVRKAIDSIDQMKVPNSKAVQAKAYLDCVIILADCPDPEPNLMYDLITRAANISQIAGLLVAVLALFIAI